MTSFPRGSPRPSHGSIPWNGPAVLPADDFAPAQLRVPIDPGVDPANHTLTIELRRVPTVAGGSLAPDSEKVLVALNGAGPANVGRGFEA